MKKLILPLLFVFNIGFGQTNFYTFNNVDSLINEKDLWSFFDTVLEKIPDKENYAIDPIIYHKIVKNDSIINYVKIVLNKKASVFSENRFELSFIQDSLFLLLDKRLPYFKLKDINGNEFSSDQLIGKPALLNFWGISCGPCILEMPELNMLKDKYGDKMSFIAFAEEGGEYLSKFLEKNTFNFYILQYAELYKHTLKIGSIPKNIFLDKDGYVKYIQGNFPYTALDTQNGIKEYEENNYFIQIIEELIKNGS